MTKSTIRQVLARLMRERGLNDNALARASGVSQPTITRIHNGTTTDPESATVAALARFFGITPAQMRGDVSAAHEPVADYNVEAGPAIRGHVPLISWVRAGHWHEASDPFLPGDAEAWFPCPVAHGPRTFVVRVRGDSMFNPHAEKSFKENDLLFVDPDREARHRSLVVVRLNDSHEATFKQLLIEGDRRYLKALNPGWPEQTVLVNGDATIVGVVIFKGEEM